MRLFTRYVLFELAKVFAVTLTAMTLMMIVIGVITEASRQGLGPAQIVQLLPFILPDALRFAVPGTILFAVSSVYGRMSSTNEIVALKSLGISAMAVLWPALGLALGLSLWAVWLNDLAVSWGREGVQRVAIEAVEQIAYGMLRTQRMYATREFSINVKRVEGDRLILPTLTFQPKQNRPALTVMAQWAEMKGDLQKKVLKIVCHDFSIHSDSDIRADDRETFEIEIPLEDASRAGKLPAIPAYMAMRIIPEQIRLQRDNIAALEQELATLAACQMLSGEFDELTADLWGELARRMRDYQEHLFRLQTEPYRRWANGFSCLCFVLVGAPTAIRRRNSDFLTSFALVFLPILIVYYPLLAFGVGAAKDGTLPPWSVWLGNLLLIVWGIWELRRVLRY